MKNILLPTDFSASSKNAIDYAIQLYKDELCTFYFLHVQKMSNFVMDDFMTASSGDDVYQAVLMDVKNELKEYVNLIRAKHKNSSHIFKEAVDYDNFIDAINQYIIHNKIDLIVMGTNGATGIAEKTFGSNTLRVIRSVNCPTLTIPSNYTFKTPDHVLFVPDKSKQISAANTQFLTDLFMKFASETSILLTESKDDLSLNQEYNLDRSIASLEIMKPKIERILDVPVSEAIAAFVQLKQVDIVAIPVKKEGVFKRLFEGSYMDDICYGSRVPLLILHED